VRAWIPRLSAALVGAGAVALPAADQGGYFAPAWGRLAFGLLLAAALGLAYRNRVELSRIGLAYLGGLTALLLWIALSTAWSASQPRTVDEVERTIIYVAAAAALLVLVSSETYPYLLGGVLGAIVGIASYALVEGAPAGGQPLSGSLGYWNALGILAAIGIVLALGLASLRLPLWARLAALASVPVLGTTLYLTHSRGAVVALGAALVAMAFLHPWLSGSRRLIAAALTVAAVAALIAGAIRAGGPTELLGHSVGAFREAPASQGRHSERLLTLSGNFRSDYWHVAWRQYRAHPLLGSGAGTFELYWNRDRKTIYGAKEAHSLYLETLAELGPLGLLLLAATLLVPFLALRRAPGPLAAAAAGAYLAFLVHAGVDWDWEMPAVTVAGVLCGGSVIVAAGGPAFALTRAWRTVAFAALGVLGAFSVLAFLGNSAVQASEEASARGNLAHAEERARAAVRWTPWSSTAWRVKGETELALHDRRAARHSVLEALRRDPHDWNLWYDLARASSGVERKHALAEAARLNPYSGEVRALRGS
jgi:O-antigen ligase